MCVFCVVLSALCGFMAVGEKMLSRLGIFVSSRRCLGENRRARIVQQYWFRLFFLLIFLPIFIARESFLGVKSGEEVMFRRTGGKNCDIRHSK